MHNASFNPSMCPNPAFQLLRQRHLLGQSPCCLPIRNWAGVQNLLECLWRMSANIIMLSPTTQWAFQRVASESSTKRESSNFLGIWPPNHHWIIRPQKHQQRDPTGPFASCQDRLWRRRGELQERCMPLGGCAFAIILTVMDQCLVILRTKLSNFGQIALSHVLSHVHTWKYREPPLVPVVELPWNHHLYQPIQTTIYGSGHTVAIKPFLRGCRHRSMVYWSSQKAEDGPSGPSANMLVSTKNPCFRTLGGPQVRGSSPTSPRTTNGNFFFWSQVHFRVNSSWSSQTMNVIQICQLFRATTHLRWKAWHTWQL